MCQKNVSSQPPSHNFSNGYGDLSPVASPTPTLLPDSSSVVLAPTVVNHSLTFSSTLECR